jgi:stearoyl-CoA desaturase (delta-9 desaturase)
MNRYFWRYWLPLHIIAVAMIVAVFLGHLTINWWLVLIAWFLVGPIGNGVGSHKLFAHRQFETWKPVEYTLALLSTLGGFAPIHFWAAIHQKHHKISDAPEDPSSPVRNGFLDSFLIYRLKESTNKFISLQNYCVRRVFKDPVLMWFSKHFIKINWAAFIILASIDLSLALSLYVLPAILEHTRENIVSSISHMPIKWLNYRNFDTNDYSQNSILVGYLTLGFGWHNNHHHNPRELINSHRWWEVDVEGQIAKLLSKPKIK